MAEEKIVTKLSMRIKNPKNYLEFLTSLDSKSKSAVRIQQAGNPAVKWSPVQGNARSHLTATLPAVAEEALSS